MDLVRFGLVIRALRRRRGWRQLDLALAAGVSQALISLIERGHAGQVLLDLIIAVANALEARLVLDLRWRGGELDRLLDHDHAALAGLVARLLRGYGWDVQVEVTYAIYGQNGSVDVLAWHQATRTLLVIEIKTEVTSGEATIRKLDEKVRLASKIASERFGWRAVSVARLLVIEETTTARRRVRAADGLFGAAFPARGAAARRWLREPDGGASLLMFLSPSTTGSGMSRRGGRHRVRRPARHSEITNPSVIEVDAGGSDRRHGPTILTGRT